MIIPSSACLNQSVIQHLLDHDPVVADYRTFFSLFDWSVVHTCQQSTSSRGRPPHPETAYLKAFLIRLREGLLYTTHLRRFLLNHPLLVIELGFHLTLDPTALYGFDDERTLPCDVRLRRKLRSFDPSVLQALLHATVRDLKQEIPGLGETVAFDVKHIYAWVQENNWRAFVEERFDKARQPKGDPDCTIGVKRSTNQQQTDGSTKAKRNCSGAMVQALPPPPLLTMAMWSWLNILNPSTKAMSPILSHFTSERWPP